MRFTAAIFFIAVLIQTYHAQSAEPPKGNEKSPVSSAAPPDKGTKNKDAEKLFDSGIQAGIAGNYNQAVEEFTKAIALDPNFAEAYNHRGAAYSNEDQLDKAIIDFTKAIKLKPNFYDAYLSRAGAYVTEGNHRLAIADFTKTIQLDPTTDVIYLLRADEYEEIGRKDLAAADRQKAKKLKEASKN